MDKEEVFFVDKENNYIKWLLIMAIFIGLLALGTYVYYKFLKQVVDRKSTRLNSSHDYLL